MSTTPYFYLKDYPFRQKKKNSLKKEFFLLGLGIILGIYLSNLSHANQTKAPLPFLSPLPAQSFNNPSPIPTQTPIPTPIYTDAVVLTIKSVQDQPQKPLKSEYTIALLGDSMLDTAGKGYPLFAEKLKMSFPKTKFNILNYGVGAKDLEYGLHRLTNSYEYLGESRPSLLSQNPDVIVVESFAYNHWSKSQSDLDKQWLNLAKIIETIKNQSQAKIVFLATIAPNSRLYARGIEGINWSDEERVDQASTVKIYLQNHLNFARSEKIAFIDAYHPSLGGDQEGKLEYINNGDNLHPSPAGHEFIANLLTSWLKKNLD